VSTTLVTAGQVMDRAANLLNDPNKTDYTYTVMIPYLNLAIEEFCDITSEANVPFSNLTSTNWSSTPIIIPVGTSFLLPPESTSAPKYPDDLIEIQEIGERNQGDVGPFRRLNRKEFQEILPITNSLRYWIWERGIIRFNPPGANVPMEVELKYVYQGIAYVANESSTINFIGSRTYLAYKTAALCAMFIGENETRADVLDKQADKAIERTINISNKGKQEIVTRHRPFRASYKARGWY
jgi:hypothetical protein